MQRQKTDVTGKPQDKKTEQYSTQPSQLSSHARLGVVMDLKKLNSKLAKFRHEIQGHWCDSFVVRHDKGFKLLPQYEQKNPPNKTLHHPSTKQVHFVTLADEKNRAATVSPNEIRIWHVDSTEPASKVPLEAKDICELNQVQVLADKKHLIAHMKYFQRCSYFESVWCTNLETGQRVKHQSQNENVQCSEVVALPDPTNAAPNFAAVRYDGIHFFTVQSGSIALARVVPYQNPRLYPSPDGNYLGVMSGNDQSDVSFRWLYQRGPQLSLTVQEKVVHTRFTDISTWHEGHWFYVDAAGILCASQPESGVIFQFESEHSCRFQRFDRHLLLEHEIEKRHSWGKVSTFTYTLLHEGYDAFIRERASCHAILQQTTGIEAHAVREIIFNYAHNKSILHPAESFRPIIPQNLPRSLQVEARSFQVELWREYGDCEQLVLAQTILLALSRLTDLSDENMQKCFAQFGELSTDQLVREFFESFVQMRQAGLEI